MSKLDYEKGFYDSGELWQEGWYLNGKLHNEEGPARIYYRRDGSVRWKEWFLDGKRHNEEGPAFIGYREDGSVIGEGWYLDGVNYTEEEWKDILFRKAFERAL